MAEKLDEEVVSEVFPETWDEFLARNKENYPSETLKKLEAAYKFSEMAHQGQIRRSGEPYISHPLGVASILADLKLDYSTIATGLLHDTVEDTVVTLEDIEDEFGETIAQLVDGVTKISQMKFRHTHEKQGENIRKMIVAMGKDVRVVLVKIADRLHNMRTMNSMPYEKQAQKALETLDIYAPLAGRLGMMSIKVELEDLSFRYAQPDQYYALVQKVNKKKKERESYIDEVRKTLRQEITLRTKMPFDVYGRPKHLYSIYKKMVFRNVEYEQVYDLLAFRILVNTIPECYEILGIVHSLFKPIPGRFKDFIAMSKANNYQSLHTTVVGPGGERIEVQIRTQEMHQVAEFGIAAHWKYKEETRTLNSNINDEAIDKFNWLRDLVSLHQQTNDTDEFLENIKTDLADTEIYVFTPKGEVKEFPDGSTPIDFAYSVHTQVGSQVVAARVNGKMVSLKYKLQNGDTVEVITSKTQNPSKDWLNYCVTARARSKIRAFVKAEQRKRAMELGKDILERAFRKKGFAANKYFSGEGFQDYLKDNGCNNIEDVYVLVGYGKLQSQSVVESLVPKEQQDVNSEKEKEGSNLLQKVIQSAVQKTKGKGGSLVSVDGMEDILVRFSKCCNPIPGDPIVGFITLGRGITIHKADCQKAFELDQDRRLDVEWNKDATKQSQAQRMVKLRVLGQDHPGLLKGMTEVISSHGINIHNAQVRTTRDQKAISLFDITVRDTKQLTDVMASLRKLNGIISVDRM